MNYIVIKHMSSWFSIIILKTYDGFENNHLKQLKKRRLSESYLLKKQNSFAENLDRTLNTLVMFECISVGFVL